MALCSAVVWAAQMGMLTAVQLVPLTALTLVDTKGALMVVQMAPCLAETWAGPRVQRWVCCLAAKKAEVMVEHSDVQRDV